MTARATMRDLFGTSSISSSSHTSSEDGDCTSCEERLGPRIVSAAVDNQGGHPTPGQHLKKRRKRRSPTEGAPSQMVASTSQTVGAASSSTSARTDKSGHHNSNNDSKRSRSSKKERNSTSALPPLPDVLSARHRSPSKSSSSPTNQSGLSYLTWNDRSGKWIPDTKSAKGTPIASSTHSGRTSRRDDKKRPSSSRVSSNASPPGERRERVKTPPLPARNTIRLRTWTHQRPMDLNLHRMLYCRLNLDTMKRTVRVSTSRTVSGRNLLLPRSPSQ